MRSTFWLGLGLVAFVAGPATSAPGASERVEPSSKWAVVYAENSCQLIREFGSGKHVVKLVLETLSPRSNYSLILVGPGIRVSTGSTNNEIELLPIGGRVGGGKAWRVEKSSDMAVFWTTAFSADFGLEDEARAASMRQYAKTGERPPAELSMTTPGRRAVGYERAAKLELIRFKSRRGRPLDLVAGSMEKPLRTLDKCSQESVTDWGIDPKIDAAIVKPAWIRNSDKIFSSSDYPSSAVQERAQADISVRLNVSPAGAVTNCVPVTPVNSPDIIAATCDILRKRAEFYPAELRDGTKVPDYYVFTIKWVMPS